MKVLLKGPDESGPDIELATSNRHLVANVRLHQVVIQAHAAVLALADSLCQRHDMHAFPTMPLFLQHPHLTPLLLLLQVQKGFRV